MTLRVNDNGIDREMTEAEETAIKATQKVMADEQKKQADEIAVKLAARQAVLDKLGLTADEAAALLG